MAPVARVDDPTLVLDQGDFLQLGVSVCNLSPALIEILGREVAVERALSSLLRVAVIQPDPLDDEHHPDVFGRYQVLVDRVRFIPHFPFDPGVRYRATFDPRSFGMPGVTNVPTLEFSLPAARSEQPTVEHIFPSASHLPENVLRFYVIFSSPMQRGRFDAQIELLQADGRPAPDVLYRAPVELWDHGMRCLTILLDPGRLKRGVGPNRELGPPLRVGDEYTLVIGSGMSGLSGWSLRESVCKRFRVTEAIREPVDLCSWEIVAPSVGSLEPVVVRFPRPLDWALLSHAISVTVHGEAIEGRVAIDDDERHWSFTPASTWSTGSYEILVAAVEDVCGNDMMGAFDRPLRSNGVLLRWWPGKTRRAFAGAGFRGTKRFVILNWVCSFDVFSGFLLGFQLLSAAGKVFASAQPMRRHASCGGRCG